MIIDSTNIIYAKDGPKERELLKSDQVIIYRSPSKIKVMGYTGTSERIVESKAINEKYFSELSKMKAQISLGSTGVGKDKQYRNVHLYSNDAVYLDGVERIGYLFQDGDVLKICEYKKGTRGSRYSSLYNILKNKLEDNDFEFSEESFVINLNNIGLFVKIINEICDERSQEKYCLVKSDKIDELNFGIFNVVYWEYKNKAKTTKNTESTADLNNYSYEIIKNIDKCNNLNELENIEHDIENVLEFCKSKIKVLKMIRKS